ncbi:MAG: response regulator [Desulfobacterales bacterium]|nr:response regulator [Desulfobacterales bacterium]
MISQKPTYQELEQRIKELEKKAGKVKKTEEELGKYKFMVESAHDAIFFKDLESRYIIANNKTLEAFGLSREDVIGKNDYELMPDQEEAEKNVSDDRIVFESGKPREISKHMTGTNGREQWFQAIKVPQFDNDGKLIGLVGIARDITDRKRAEEERENLQAQFQQAQKMEAIGTLAGGIAHNFNNALMSIQGCTSLMMKDKNPSHPDFAYLSDIEEYVRNATGLAKDLLGFASGGKYEPKPIDLNKLIRHENRMFGQTKKEIRIQDKFDNSLWTVEVDQGQIRQALLNLYVNAWQVMPGGGDLYVQTENVILDERYVKPFEITPGRYIKISVTDTGIGIDEATMEKIFDPFFTTKEMGTGTGLGLASVYGIVKNHGGFINVYSEKGVGTTFNIYLPASEKEAVEKKKPSTEVIKGEGIILLVDDEEMIINVGEQLLTYLGYAVKTAKSGKEAIEIFENNKDDIDLVVLDMIMPGMGGGETYDRLKEINPDIKVLLSSGYSINGQAHEILNRGCDEFIQKPYTMKEISQRIRAVLDKD